MKIHVILNGELKTCCSAYPTAQVQSILSSWFAGDKTVEPVIVSTLLIAGLVNVLVDVEIEYSISQALDQPFKYSFTE